MRSGLYFSVRIAIVFSCGEAVGLQTICAFPLRGIASHVEKLPFRPHYYIIITTIATRCDRNAKPCASLELIVEDQLKPACKYTIQDGRRKGVGLGSVLGLVLGLV